MADDPTPGDPAKGDPDPKDPTLDPAKEPPAKGEPDPAKDDGDKDPDDLGPKGKKALDAERKGRRDAEARANANEDAAKRLKEIEDAAKSEVEKLTDDLGNEKARGDGLETELARLKAAVKHGLGEDDLDLLGNGTAEEIEARAERLAQRLGTKGRQPTRTLGQPEEKPEPTADDWLRQQARSK